VGDGIVLVKFGEQSNIVKLREEGLLYLNNLPYFQRTEDRDLRGDPCDGVEHILRGIKGKVTTFDGEELGEVTDWELRVHPPVPENTNTFCMYAIRPDGGTFRVSERNYEFGPYALVLLDTEQFIQRVVSTLERDAITHDKGLVRYVDDEHVGGVGLFKKKRRFAYQSEYRFVCYDGPGGPREVKIGSIEDISVMIPSDEINSRIRFVGRYNFEVF